MYAAGSNADSQLCLDTSYNDNDHYVSKLTKINIANATYVSQGPYHTLFKLGKQVVGCGNNQNNQMGPNKGTFVQPTLLFQNEDLMSTAACEDGSIFVIKNNLYVIGR